MTVSHLNMPPWTGKALGAAAALVFAPPSPAVLAWWLAGGIGVGHLLDTLGDHLGEHGKTPSRRHHRQVGSRASLRFTFAAMGRIAAASGRVSPEHLRYADRLMARLAFTPERRREAMAWFHGGRDTAFPFDALGNACRDEFAAHPVLRDLAAQSLCRMAAVADTPRATAELLTLGERVGWDREHLARQALAVAALLPASDPRARAREILGVRADDGAELIRLAYRRRVARWHPDRLPDDAAPAERQAAECRMSQLREALETLLGTLS